MAGRLNEARKGLGGERGGVQETLVGKPLDSRIQLIAGKTQPTGVDRVQPIEQPGVGDNGGVIDQGVEHDLVGCALLVELVAGIGNRAGRVGRVVALEEGDDVARRPSRARPISGPIAATVDQSAPLTPPEVRTRWTRLSRVR